MGTCFASSPNCGFRVRRLNSFPTWETLGTGSSKHSNIPGPVRAAPKRPQQRDKHALNSWQQSLATVSGCLRTLQLFATVVASVRN
eukprot:1763268-Alexandrium_andersonii.AAC.1